MADHSPRDIDKIVESAQRGTKRKLDAPTNPYKEGTALHKLWDRREADRRKKRQSEAQNTDSNNQ